jgi:hypothetical protein
MSLLNDIQAAVIGDGSDLGPVLLKLRFLAARLGSQSLADWVKHESEGYPENVPIPTYRLVPVMYTATFSGPFGAAIKNAPIAPYLIEKCGGEQWNRYEIRQSIAGIEELLASTSKGGSLGINAANLILLLQDKVYSGYACNDVSGEISRASLVELRHSVRSRILELTIEFEKFIPEAGTIALGHQDANPSPKSSAVATQIYQQIFYGNVTSIHASGDHPQFNVAIGERNVQDLIQFLKQAGLTETDAQQLGDIAATEEPESKQEPLGSKTKKWLVDNMKKAIDGTWNVGVAVATAAIKEALLKYYGLK